MKFANWLTRTIVTAAIMTCISVATTWVMVNAYVQQILGNFGAAVSTVEPVGLTDVLTGLTGGAAGGQGTALPASTGIQGLGEGRAEDASGEPVGEDESDAYPVPPDALPVMGQVSTSEDELYFSMDDLSEKKEMLTSEERMEIFTLLITKLPAAEVQTISALLEDGLTAEELEEASGILQQHLSEEEYSNLLDIVVKYE